MFRNKFLGMVLLMGLLVSQSVPKARAATSCDHAQFVSDLTAPDGSSFAPGAAFTKTWRLKNIGTCTWTAAYNLVWMGGDILGAPSSIRLPVEVAPGQMVDVSVNLTAPETSGHYKGLFKIANAAGTQFGIGDAASDPFWVDIHVVNVDAVIYDFVTSAPYAQWKSGAGILPFPGTSGDSRGFAYQVNPPHLEDDSYDSTSGLLVVPQNKYNGYIQATFPEFQIQAGDRLQTLVNCEYGATGCYVTFRIDYLLPSGVQKTLWSWKEAYDKRFYRANIDLSSLAGQKVRFVFMLLASGFASGDRAIWGSARILRSGTVQPPAPPPTLTSLPPLPATATPLGQPPPTIPPAGCDRATFITDVTVQDGTVFAPGAAFTKTWRLKNSGTCVWTTAYKLVYYSGDPMGAPTAVNLPWSAEWGQTVDISVNMVAPTTTGKYRGYWILANASGQFFGIGATASNSIWVEINVSGKAPFEGNDFFRSNICAAEWRSGAGPLPCPGTEGDRKGFVIPLQYSHLEDGTMGPAPTFLMAPENRYNGYIQGIYPAITVLPGDHFVTVTGCEYGYNCYVTFRLDYMTANGGIFNFWSWREQNDKKNHMVSVDLTPLAGRSVRFILTLLATGSAMGDRVRWGGPALIRMEPGIPPTLTPSPTATQTPAPPTTVPPPVVSSPLIKKLFMSDPSNGWGIGNNYVLRTADGGTTWYNVSPPGVASIRNGFFRDGNQGWVIAALSNPAPDGSAVSLFRTTDGGRIWITYDNIPFDGGSMQFLDDFNGFVLAGLPSGMHKHAVSLYQTSDGGATWTLKYAVDPSQPVNTLPFGGVKYGLTFRDPSTGWVGGYSPETGTVYLYKTTDGGVTWVKQPLALPAGSETADFSTTAPRFFGTNDAILPVWMTTNAGRDLYIYTTHDGGATWSRSANFVRNDASIAFASWKDVFGYARSDVFHVTNDAGATWQTVTPNVRFSELAYQFLGMDFVSPTAGWVLIENESRTTSLYRTTDGGSTWTQLTSGGPTPTPTPFIGTITVQSIDIEIIESQPLQANAIVRGTLSDSGCTTIAGINQLLEGNTFRITIMLNTDSAVQCTNTPTPFERVVPLYTSNVPPGRYTVSAHSVEKAFEFVPRAVTTFGQLIVNALNARDFATADVLMDQSFTIALWQSQGTSYTPDLAMEQLQTNYIGPNTALISDPNRDLNGLLNGANPYSIMGLDPFNSYALFVSGWGLDGKDEALLYVTRLSDGSLYWHSILIAKGGFAAEGSVSHETFCADARIPILIEQLKGSMNQSNSDMFAGIVSPAHGMNVHLWAYETPVNFTTATARDVFTSTEIYRWGSGPAGGTEYGTGTFSEIIQPKMLEVLNAPNMETYCDTLTKVFPLGRPWPYPDIRYYNLYKPASSSTTFDFRTWLIGFEYVDGQPYLYSMVSIVWEP